MKQSGIGSAPPLPACAGLSLPLAACGRAIAFGSAGSVSVVVDGGAARLPPPERGRSTREARRVGVNDYSTRNAFLTPTPTLPLSGGGSALPARQRCGKLMCDRPAASDER